MAELLTEQELLALCGKINHNNVFQPRSNEVWQVTIDGVPVCANNGKETFMTKGAALNSLRAHLYRNLILINIFNEVKPTATHGEKYGGLWEKSVLDKLIEQKRVVIERIR